ncbi:hypothetical protein Tsubulata_039760 [Turnera subulata]|uniref:Autophagy-related protein 2 n=1 Tax=Turnera subulata TaxID=218843 RepID=A0A9Q0J342_9ROSI|nr:hypothetical protein Tsubulata_039760 [Turnera subulata]
MFTWNIARSAEAAFSRWAVKRLCKFMLKKKLGQFILGDIDLDQLDVQLSHGTIQLADLALNVDYLNDKLGAAASVMVKEGSVGSLTVKMPWRGKGFEVEVDELELVLVPCSRSNLRTGGESTSNSNNSNNNKDGDQRTQKGGARRRDDNDFVDCNAKYGSSVAADVHEGVKTIAKLVKWFMTSFHVKVRKLIVAFEPSLERDDEETKVGSQRMLVLRVSEIECGTCVSEDGKTNSDAKVDSILGISQLTSFVNFEGAVLELLEMDDIDKLSCSLSEDFFSRDRGLNATIPVVTGKKGGFSGNLKLSIPWTNGSLDIGKVDADVCIDPIELRAQPSTIKWFLLSWEAFKNINGGGSMHSKSTDSVYFNSASYFHSSMSLPATVAPEKIVSGFTPSLSSLGGKDSASEVMLPEPNFITNWVPISVEENEKENMQELDLGASMDQFFECLDGMRNSQSVLGSSGMWNWTNSVFSALTATSSLASGSLHMPSEQQHVQTSLNATLAGISIILSFQDEHQEHRHELKGDQSTGGSGTHYLVAECKHIIVGLQICPREMKFEGTAKYIEVADYSSSVDYSCHSMSIQQLQSKVLDALPPFASSVEDSESEGSNIRGAPSFSSGNLLKIKLMSTSGTTQCEIIANNELSDGSLARPTSFTLKLPQLLFWVSFGSIDGLFNLLKDIGKSVELKDQRNEFRPSYGKHQSGANKEISRPGGRTPSSREKFRGNISIPNARIIICFPFESWKDVGGCFAWDQFIALDFTSPATVEKGKFQDSSGRTSGASSWKRYTSNNTSSLLFSVGNLKMYLVNPSCKDDVGINPSAMPMMEFCALRILSAENRDGCLSVISMLWQEGPVTGPWIAERAKSLAASEESKCRNKSVAGGYEFASVTAVKDLEDTNSQSREEMILSSSFLLHIELFTFAMDLDSSQYGILHSLCNQMINRLARMSGNAIGFKEMSSAAQTSVLLECKSLEIIIRPDIKQDVKSSLQSELPGSWNCLKMRIQKFSLLSVSNIGSIRGSNFFWLAHGEGKLWGSVTGVTDQEFLLISCSNSTRKRGDGGGSNVLSSGFAGSDIINLWDPESSGSFTSVTIRCATMIAVGGRLDWLDSISSFLIMPSPEVEHTKASADALSSELNVPCRTSFVLKLVDIGLSYEPCSKNFATRSHHSESTYLYFKEDTDEKHVACLLAASSFTLSSSRVGDSFDNDYKIRVQDLGLLLCAACENLGGSYAVEYIHEMGYVKVAQEALIEAILRTNCKNGLLWELEFSKSHVFVETCHDTTSGLMHLAGQLQQLFAPDLEESIVHLQNRWSSVNHAEGSNEFSDVLATHSDSSSSTSEVYASAMNTSGKSGLAGLMDEICEDAFHLDINPVCQYDSSESQVGVSLDHCLNGEACSPTSDIFSYDMPFDGSVPPLCLESSQTSFLQNGSIPELIEGYCLTDLGPLSELSIGGKSSSENPKCISRDHRDENGRWFEEVPLSIVEDHISEASGTATMPQFLEDNLPSIDCASCDEFGKATGRMIFKNIDVSWRMYGGCDWEANDEPSSDSCGRDASTCLELALSGMEFQYYFFPVGKINASKLSLSVRDIYLCDRSKNAPWKRVLGYYNSKGHPRESSSKAFDLYLEAVRPDPLIPLEEYRLHTAFLPLLLHLHQNQLDFLISFFGANNSSAGHPSDHPQNSDVSKTYTSKSSTHAGHTIADEALLPYFQASSLKFDIWPILLRVDYCPSRVDLAALRGGKYVELVNLVPWKGVELQLKHVHGVGVYGWGSICETVIGEWLEDVSHNQIHKIFQGLPTIRSLVAVGTGATKLVSLPVESYRKDQRILKGMQRGTIAFLRSISLEAVGLGVHLAAGAHDILRQAENMISSIPPSVSWQVQSKTKPNVRCNQPKDAQQGIQQAYESLSDGLGKSASALVRTPLKKYQRGASAGTALATAVRAVPAAAIAPVSACAGAAHYALLGIRNSLDPDRKKESIEKYLGPTVPHDWK